MRRSRSIAVAVVALQLGMAVVLPALHAEQHRLHGADHVHTAWGIVPLDGSGVSEHAAAHADFDRVLGELDLADVFFAGATDVDCRYADFTLVDACAVAGSHAVAFGDALLHQHRHAHGPSHDVDFGHGRGALAHFAASLLPNAPVLLPPAPTAQPIAHESPRFASLVSRTLPACSCRGPPLA